MKFKELIDKLNTIDGVSASVDEHFVGKIIKVVISAGDDTSVPGALFVPATVRKMGELRLQDSRRTLKYGAYVSVNVLSLALVCQVLQDYIDTPMTERDIMGYKIEPHYWVIKSDRFLLVPSSDVDFKLIDLKKNALELNSRNEYFMTKKQYVNACSDGLIDDSDRVFSDYHRVNTFVRTINGGY